VSHKGDKLSRQLQMQTTAPTLSQRYRELHAQIRQCPIEAGFMFALADNECPHGNLPSDKRIECTCWGPR
jgi:hypothetical protein